MKTLNEHKAIITEPLYINGKCMLPKKAITDIAQKNGFSEQYVRRCINSNYTDYNQDVIDLALQALFADQEAKKRQRENIAKKIKEFISST